MIYRFSDHPIIILVFLSKFHPQKTEIFKDNFNTFFLFHCTLSMHLSYTRTGLKVDADNIPEVGGFLSRDFGSKCFFHKYESKDYKIISTLVF
jgi:hypothetical protein